MMEWLVISPDLEENRRQGYKSVPDGKLHVD